MRQNLDDIIRMGNPEVQGIRGGSGGYQSYGDSGGYHSSPTTSLHTYTRWFYVAVMRTFHMHHQTPTFGTVVANSGLSTIKPSPCRCGVGRVW